MKILGGLLLTIGIIAALFFLFLFDTTVLVPETGDRVNNLGLLNTRLVGTIGSGFVSLVGVILLVAGLFHSHHERSTLDGKPGGFPLSTRNNTDADVSMADRLDEIEARKRSAERSGSQTSILDELKRNVTKE